MNLDEIKQKCTAIEKCLPESSYRNSLAGLHFEMIREMEKLIKERDQAKSSQTASDVEELLALQEIRKVLGCGSKPMAAELAPLVARQKAASLLMAADLVEAQLTTASVYAIAAEAEAATGLKEKLVAKIRAKAQGMTPFL
jgi:hypothetical protein